LTNNLLYLENGTSVSLSGGSRAVAAAGGCREEEEEYDVVVDDSASCCAGVAAIPVARLSDIWPPLCMLLSGGFARPLGYLRAETH